MEKLLLLFLFVCLSYNLSAQDTTYYYKTKKSSKFNYDYYKIFSTKNNKEKNHFIRTYSKDNVLKYETLYKTSKKKKKTIYRVWHKNGQLHIVSNYKKGKRSDLLSYWENGSLKRKDIYKRGKFINGICWDKNGKKVTYYPFEIRAKFNGNPKGIISYIQNKFKISPKYENLKATITFKIDCAGKIKNVRLIKRTNSIDLDLKIVKFFTNMPNWEPAMQDGKPVTTSFTIPLSF